MSSFAIVLLSETMFGGAQKRFLNLHKHFRKTYGDRAWFITSANLKFEVKEAYGDSFCDGILSIGDKLPGQDQDSESIIERVKKGSNKPSIVSKLKSSILFDFYFYFKSRKRTFKQFQEIKQIAKEKNIDRFLAVYSGVLPLYFYFNESNRKERIVFSNMDSWFSHFEKNPLKKYFRQFTLFHRAHVESNHVDILSPFIESELKLRNILPARQPHSITACSFIDYSNCKLGSKKEMIFVFSGRLEEDKNPLKFLKVALILGQKYPEVQFIILGKGRLKGDVEALLKTYKGENIKYKGYVTNPCAYFAETSVFVSLQTDNNYPSQSVLEAMACGNAIIASNVGDTDMFVNEENGFLIENTFDVLLEKMEFCILNSEEVQRKGRFAFNFVRENFSVEKASAYYYSLLFPEDENL